MNDNDKPAHKPAIAIIGSGIAGLACATALTVDYSISLFDKSRGLSGRMSTRRAEAHQFDHGAQYFRANSAEFADWLAPLRGAGHVRDWQAKAVRIASNGAVTQTEDDAPKLVFAPTMNMVGKAILAGRPQIKTYLDCQIEAIEGQAQSWVLRSADAHFGPFAHVVLAIPAAQASALLPMETDFSAALAKVKMIGCHTLMLGYAAQEIDLPDWDCAHFDDEILGFAAVNSGKPGRVGDNALVIQTNHQWSEAHIETDMDEVSAEIKRRFSGLTGLSVTAGGYDRLHRWRYASTTSPAAHSYLSDAALGLSAIGDWCTGSKVEDGFLSGYELAQGLLA